MAIIDPTSRTKTRNRARTKAKTSARIKTKKLKNDFDNPWQKILNVYFKDFMALCLPDKYKEIDWKRGYQFLDKQLEKISKDAPIGKRSVDKLLQVHLKNNAITLILLHIEVQWGYEKEFSQRMLIYNYRLFDRYRKPVVSIAFLIDGNPNWQPSSYKTGYWECSLELKFLTLKLLDFKTRIEELSTSKNRFAPVILAQLAATEKAPEETKLASKISLTKSLYRRGWSKRDILNLYEFIDWAITLPEPFEIEYNQSINEFEESVKMPYVTTAERIGIQKGKIEGKLEGKIEGKLEGKIEGKLEGKAEEKMKIAKNLLVQNVSITTISIATGLSELDIQKLRKL